MPAADRTLYKWRLFAQSARQQAVDSTPIKRSHFGALGPNLITVDFIASNISRRCLVKAEAVMAAAVAAMESAEGARKKSQRYRLWLVSISSLAGYN